MQRRTVKPLIPKEPTFKRNQKVASMGYDQLKQKRVELLALQAERESKTKRVELASERQIKKTLDKQTRKDQRRETTKKLWDKLAAQIISTEAKDSDQSLTPVESPGGDGAPKLGTVSEHSERSGSSGPRLIRPKLFDLVHLLTQSKEMNDSLQTQAPKKRNRVIEHSLAYGKHRKDVADKYDSFENIESCRYLRKRTKDKYELNPFSIEEIFRDTRVKGRSSFK